MFDLLSRPTWPEPWPLTFGWCSGWERDYIIDSKAADNFCSLRRCSLAPSRFVLVFFLLEAEIPGADSRNQPAFCCWLCCACCWNLSEGNSVIYISFFSRLMAGRSIFTRITVRSLKPIKYELLFIGSYTVTCLCWRAEAPGFCTWLGCLCFPCPLDGAGVMPSALSAFPHIGQQMATDITIKGLCLCWKWALNGLDSCFHRVTWNFLSDNCM